METTIKKTMPPLEAHHEEGRTVRADDAPDDGLHVRRHWGRHIGRRLSRQSTQGLVKEITLEAIELARKQLELCIIEARADLKAEAQAAAGLVFAVVGGLFATALLLATAVLGLSLIMPAWGAGLIVSGLVLGLTGVSAFQGWRLRVREPLEETRRGIREDLRVVKESVA